MMMPPTLLMAQNQQRNYQLRHRLRLKSFLGFLGTSIDWATNEVLAEMSVPDESLSVTKWLIRTPFFVWMLLMVSMSSAAKLCFGLCAIAGVWAVGLLSIATGMLPNLSSGVPTESVRFCYPAKASHRVIPSLWYCMALLWCHWLNNSGKQFPRLFSLGMLTIVP
jgi:hypothetical protein